MKKLPKKSVIWRWVISYTCIILISAVSSLVIYDRSRDFIKERQEKINEVLLEQATRQIQDCVVMMEKLREEILINSSYNSLNKSGFNRYISTTYKHYLLYRDLNTYLKLNNSYSHIILYFKDDDRIISDSSVNFSDRYWEIYNSLLGLTFDEWINLINGTYDNFHAKNIKAGNIEATIFARTIQPPQTGRQKVNLFVIFTRDNWADLLGEYQDTSMILLDQNMQTAVKFDYASIITSAEDEAKIIEAVRSGKKEVVLKSNEVIKLYYSHNNAPYFLCILTPESVYIKTMHNFQLIFCFIFLVSIVFSIVLIIVFVNTNYRPVKDLLKTLLSTGIFQSSEHREQSLMENENEFAIVKKGMAQVSNSYNSVKMALSRQNKVLRKVYLSRLLNGKAKLLPDKQLNEIYGLNFKYNDFVVVLMYVHDFDPETDINYDIKENSAGLTELDHAQSVLVEKYDKLISERGWVVNHTITDDLLVFVICVPPAENNADNIKTVIKKGMKSIADSYGVEFSVSISALHSNLEMMSIAYQEALQAFEALKMHNLGGFVCYSDISEMFSSSYNYPFEMEQKLIKEIQLGNFTNAKAIVSEVIQSNIDSKRYISRDIIRCLMFDLLGTVMKTFDAKEESQQLIKQLKPAKRLAECTDLQSMKKVIEEILLKCCEFFRVETSNDEKLYYKIQAYIRENYWDPNLSVAFIAEQFSISPVTLSRKFREITGCKITTFLSEVRIEQSKKLLLLSDANLSYIANSVGFGSTKTFTRIFKQVEGCTPGQWREKQKYVV